MRSPKIARAHTGAPSGLTRALRLRSLLPLALAADLLLGCKHGQTPATRAHEIDRLRADAAAHPKDPDLAVKLAVAEQLADFGEAARGTKALVNARALAPKRLALLFVDAETHVLEGRAEEAFRAYIELLQRASEDPDAPYARALAELALHALVDMNDAVDDYRARLSALLEALAPKADALGLAVSHQLALQRSGLAMQRGDLKAALAALDVTGCVRKAQVAGPFGPRPMLGFDQTFAPEKSGPFAASYPLGEGRKSAPVRNLETHRCVLALGRGAHDALPGVSYVRAELEVQAAATYAVRIESPNSYVLWIDGKELSRADLRAQVSGGVHYALVELTPGKHELKAKVSSRHPNPALLVALRAAGADAVARTALPAGDDPFARFVAGKLAFSRGDVLGARERIRALTLEQPTAHWLILSAGAALADPLRAPEQRRDTARRELTRAQKANPEAWYPNVGLSNLEAAEGRAKEATDLLASAAKRYPTALAAQTAWIEQLKQRGFDEEADRVLDALSEKLPHACAVAAMRLERARSRSRLPEIERETGNVLACDANSNARYRLLMARREYDDGAKELVRLRSLGDPQDETQRLDNALELAEIRGDQAEIKKLREARTGLWPDRPEPVLDRADRLLSDGKRTEATAFLAKSIAAYPAELGDVARVHEALGGSEEFAGLRKDGRAVIKSFEASGEDYNGPQLLLLDYTIVRVFPDGSSVELTHNIFRVQSEEAVDEAGEFSVPEGARLLSLHTVKADGRRLEPDPIAGKASWSLPGLALGDYVEFETIKAESPSLGFPGGYLGNRFYFKSFEVPFYRSELVMLMPKELKPVVDPRGEAPKAEESTHNGLTLLRWAVDKSRPLPMEPGSVSTREFLPSINVGNNANFGRYVESLRDLLSDKDAYDPEAKAFVDQLLAKGKASSTADKVALLHGWVTEQVEATDEVFGSAPAMLAARTGSRERVLRYLLGLAGVPADLALVRGIEADHTEGALPDPETYGYLLVRLREDAPVRWLHAGTRHAPPSFLPPQVRGERALLLSASGEVTTVPKGNIDDGRREIDVEVQVERDGKAKLRVHELQRGGMAFALRDSLEEIPESELSSRFEQSYAANILPGARLTSLKVDGRDDNDAPLALDYTLEVSSLGHRSGDDLRIPGLFASSLQARFTRLHTRTTTALVAPDQATDVRVRIVLPSGARLASAPKAAEFKHASGAHYKLEVREEKDAVVVSRSLRLPTSRVAPAEYGEFAVFCRGVDLAEASDTAVRMPAP